MEATVSSNNTMSRHVSAFDRRVHEVDFLRGILIIIVLIDHILNQFLLNTPTWYQITGNEFWRWFYNGMDFYWNCVARSIIRQVVLVLFCFVSGLSCAFSKNNWKRAGLMIVIFAALNVGSNLLNSWKWLGDTVCTIDFNVIGVLAFSTLFYCFVQKCTWRGLLASCLGWFLFSTFGMTIITSIPGTEMARVPALIEPTTPVADWMPIVPYIFFFFLGAVATYFIYADKKSKLPRGNWEKPFCFIGRHTLWVYLGHQAVLIPVFMIVTKILEATH